MNSSANNLLAFLAISLPLQPASFCCTPSGRWNSRPSLTGRLLAALNVNLPPPCRNIEIPPVFRPTPTFPHAQQAGPPATVSYQLTAVNSFSRLHPQGQPQVAHPTQTALVSCGRWSVLPPAVKALVTFVSAALAAVSLPGLLDPNFDGLVCDTVFILRTCMVMQDGQTYLTIPPVLPAQRFRLPFAQHRPGRTTRLSAPSN
ncbi:hypothetical protein F5144DRAFT_187297 [Chaetomium tenue]|uniref:Uncharacterized protein n=1 Tax=Chaetomium tenue TaxID=1854479 RepID=A0ACB7PG25_9PEZI|nr:hypothetical protein F5144DRAFT_187297 [Chaetomium globosum]